MDLLLYILVPNVIYLVVALGLHWWVRHETRILVDEQMRRMRRMSAAILFAPGLLVGAHAILPGFALAVLMVQLYLGEGGLPNPAWQLGCTIGPMFVLYVVLLIRDRAIASAAARIE